MKLIYSLTTLLLLCTAYAEDDFSINYDEQKRVYTYTFQNTQSPEFKRLSMPVNGLISAVYNKSKSAAVSRRVSRKAEGEENLPEGSKVGVMNLNGEKVLDFIYDYVVISKDHIITLESKSFGKSVRTLAVRDRQGTVKSEYPVDDHFLTALQYPVFSFKTVDYFGLLNVETGKVIRPQFISVGSSSKNIYASFKDNCVFTFDLNLIPKHKGNISSIPKDKHMTIINYNGLSALSGTLWDADGKLLHGANENEFISREKKDKAGNPRIFTLISKKPKTYTFFTSEGKKVDSGTATEVDYGWVGFSCKVGEQWKAFDYSGKLLHTSSKKLSVTNPWLIQEEIIQGKNFEPSLVNLYDYTGKKIADSVKIKSTKDDIVYLESNKAIVKNQLLSKEGYPLSGKFIRDLKSSLFYTISGKLICGAFEQYKATENALFILEKGAKTYKVFDAEGAEIKTDISIPSSANLNFISGDFILFRHDKKVIAFNPLKNWSLSETNLAMCKVSDPALVLLKVEDELRLLNANCETVDTLKPVDKSLTFSTKVEFIRLDGDKKAIVHKGKFLVIDKYLGNIDGPQVFQKDGLLAYFLDGKMTPFSILHKYAEKSVYSDIKERFYTTVQPNDKIVIYNEKLEPIGSRTLKLTGDIKSIMYSGGLRINALHNYSALHY